MIIEYTPRFKETLDNMFSCNRQYYSKHLLELLMCSLKKYRDLLSSNPLMGPVEPILVNLAVDYRYIILHKYLKLIYFIHNDVLYFADIWDTRQMEEHLKQRMVIGDR